jgi:hypothetical protein
MAPKPRAFASPQKRRRARRPRVDHVELDAVEPRRRALRDARLDDPEHERPLQLVVVQVDEELVREDAAERLADQAAAARVVEGDELRVVRPEAPAVPACT